MAKVAGYKAHYVTGYVNKGKTKGPHAWVEIKTKNKTYVYDPNFQKEFGPKGLYRICDQIWSERYTEVYQKESLLKREAG